MFITKQVISETAINLIIETLGSHSVLETNKNTYITVTRSSELNFVMRVLGADKQSLNICQDSEQLEPTKPLLKLI